MEGSDRQHDVAGRQGRSGDIAQHQHLAIAKIDDGIAARLGHGRLEHAEAVDAAGLQPQPVGAGREICDEVAAFALADDEEVGPGAACQHVIAEAAAQGLRAAAADDDVVEIIPADGRVVRPYLHVLQMREPDRAQAVADERIDAATSLLDDHAGVGPQRVGVVPGAADQCGIRA
jgi:hypothetical protein